MLHIFNKVDLYVNYNRQDNIYLYIQQVYSAHKLSNFTNKCHEVKMKKSYSLQNFLKYIYVNKINRNSFLILRLLGSAKSRSRMIDSKYAVKCVQLLCIREK